MNNSGGIYNIISLVFLVLTVGVIAYVGLELASEPEPEPVRPLSELPTMIPPTETDTPTATDTATIPASFTPTGTKTVTPTITLTPSITPLPSETITSTPSATGTPQDTPTPAESAIPTEQLVTPTDSPYFFDLAAEPTLRPNDTAAGCQFQAVAGSVLGLDGLEHPNRFVIHVVGPNVDRTRETASNTLFGPVSGWEVVISQAPQIGEYNVWVESLAGTQLSLKYPVIFPGNCAANVAIMTFQQTQPLGR